MDFYSINSEATDPLDFLSPPVKRIQTVHAKDLPRELVNLKNKLLRACHKDNTTGVTPLLRTDDEPSTSLILKRTSQSQFLEQYSVNYTTDGQPSQRQPSQNTTRIARNKPLIKVTVIPKTDQSHNTKLFRKRRYAPKKVQSTSSNQENSIQTKNVYLVVAGRRKEKIYEIRTTGSADFSNDQIIQNDDTSLNDLLNTKQLVKSLNMDKKRQKEKSKKSDYSKQQPSYNGRNNSHECNCTKTSLKDETRTAKSRVKIYGQLGLTEDDKYVLKYGASVDDKPVLSDVAQLLSEFSPYPIAQDDDDCPTSGNSAMCLAESNKTTSMFRNQRDSCIQTKIDNDCEYKKPPMMDLCECTQPSQESQATQVNFNIQVSPAFTPKTIKPVRRLDKKIQCNCCAANDNFQEVDEKALNENPLVIISVYPKQKSSEIGKSVKTENKQSLSPQKGSVITRNIKVDKNTEKRSVGPNRREVKPIIVSRSPSPVKKFTNTRVQESKQIETNTVRTLREKKSPSTSSPLKAIKDKINQKDKLEVASPRRSRFASPVPLKPQTATNPQNVKKTQMRSKDIGTNTDHLQTKKALVDSYTKKYSSGMNPKRPNQPRVDTSKVTINVDGETEYYDVQFNLDDAITDLRIRQNFKDVDSHNFDEGSCASMENLLLLPDSRPRSRSLSVALNDNQSHGTPLNKNVSRLTIRDSLEICHRREDKASHGIKNTQTCLADSRDENMKNDTKFLAPIKHYIGDDCSINDPMARDREIRQLLGVDKCRKITTTTHQDSISEKRNSFLFQCFNRKKCDNNLETCPNSAMKTSPAQCYIKKDKDCIKTDDSNKIAPGVTSLYQQLVVNRNIQVFLQVEQFAKKKPIILTRKQYQKVKKTIQKTISNNIGHQKHKCPGPNSAVSVGEIKKKKKIDMSTLTNKQVQTEHCVATITDACGSIQDIKFNTGSNKAKLPSDKKQAAKRDKTKIRKDENGIIDNVCNCKANDKTDLSTRKTRSSVEVHYADVAYMRHVTFSSKGNFMSATSVDQGNSFLTIFRGHKKSPTPNLGTSSFSVNSDEHSDKSIKVLMEPRDSKRRKPFLQRLISYLVMRSAKDGPKCDGEGASRPPTLNSSVDSYHINSSLQGVEVSSSLYDTSASFYSNHTIYPVNSKMKRGFFSSVRGFLTNRKS